MKIDGQETFRTSQVAKLLGGVTRQSVVNWINQKKLKSYQIEGGWRYVTKSDLLAFMTANNIPTPKELQDV